MGRFLRLNGRASEWIVAAVIGAALTLPVAGVIGPWLAWTAGPVVTPTFLVIWLLATWAFGSPVAAGLTTRVDRTMLTASAAGTTVATAVLLAGPLRLLREGATWAERLRWMLDAEDNARFLGVAREVIASGPAGGKLTGDLGNGFVALAVTWLSAVRSPTIAGDPRLAAIDVINTSVILSILTLGVSMLLLIWALLWNSRCRPQPSLLLAGSAAVTAVAVSIATGVPLRNGFLSFVWGISWMVLTVGGMALLLRLTGPRVMIGALAHLGFGTVMVVRSWPFLLPAIAPVLLITLGLLGAGLLRRAARRRGLLAGLGIALAAMLAVVAANVRSSALWELWKDAGAEALTIGGTAIFASDRTRDVAIASVLASVAVLAGRAVATRRVTTEEGTIPAALLPVLAATGIWLFYGALRLAADLLTDGVLNYAGAKVFYGAVAVSFLLALPVLLIAALDLPAPLPLTLIVSFSLFLGTGQDLDDARVWRDATAPREAPHAVVMAEAIERTSPSTPIRCLPDFGVRTTPRARWASYFCATFAEDAFNERPFSAFRNPMLTVEADTFDDLIEQALRERPNEYLLALRITAGPGWFGWDGRS